MYEQSARTAAIAQLLKGANGVVTYDALCRAAGAPLGVIRSAIASARRVLERDDHIVFETVHRVGLRRLTDSEIVQSSHHMIRALRRKARAGTRRLDSVSAYQSLSPTDQITSTINRAVFAAVQDQTRPAPATRPTAHALPDLAAIAGGKV